MAEGEINASKAILGGIESIIKRETDFLIIYNTSEKAKLNILNSHVFKYYMSPSGTFIDYPTPNDPEDIAKINEKKVEDYDKTNFENSCIVQNEDSFTIHTGKVNIVLNKAKGTMEVYDKRNNKTVFTEKEPISYTKCSTTQSLTQRADEYFFGGGMQNGRFTHKGEIIKIMNTNVWTDGGVTSPCPFYWSTNGYGVLRNTWQPGIYDFGSNDRNVTKTSHKEEQFDAFYFINSQPRDILHDYYELTGRPIFMPEYAFYEAHLNTFNRDYWVEVTKDTPGARLFEDSKYYKSYKPHEVPEGKEGILESLNGEKNNYQFSARAMIDRYRNHDLPLGWFLPNDGYGSGYGQTDSLDGDIANLNEFGKYARSNGVEVAVWTESQLEPADPSNPKKGERDLVKEVRIAGVRALKCDVAWIGSGYSFALNAVEHADDMFKNETKEEIRTMIIMVDGWAGTQRHAGIWSGDQVGGNWEYIRFHIPTYSGSGLSGQPIVGSDMDGIYGGNDRHVNIRDFQWKAFTPIQLNMDGWGKMPKCPFSYDNIATTINRAYLKMKSMLMPYNYTIGYESTHGLPMIRAMFLEFPNETSAYTNDSKYQYMWGSSVLVAPIYNDDNDMGVSIRNGIYLPYQNQIWIDFFTGEKYQGGKIYNNIKSPLWKIPVFVKDGAIIPFTNPNNNVKEIDRSNRIVNIYPNGRTAFSIYEDDGISAKYLKGEFATTNFDVIGPESNQLGGLLITIHKTVGSYKNMVNERITTIRIMCSKEPESIKAAINGKAIEIQKAKSEEDFNKMVNIFYYTETFRVNPYLDELSDGVTNQNYLLLRIDLVDITENEIQIKVNDFENIGKVFGSISEVNNNLNPPTNIIAVIDGIPPGAVLLSWTPADDSDYSEIERDGVIFCNITGNSFIFDGFKYETEHTFRIRSVNDSGVSKWSNNIVIRTSEDPYKQAIKGVKVACSLPCESSQEICNLTDCDDSTLWHTDWGTAGQAKPEAKNDMKINIDLGNVYEVDRMEYTPREDAGNGTLVALKYRYSINGKDWSPMSDQIDWEHNENKKILYFNGAKFRFLELVIVESIGRFGSGKHMHFFRKTY